MNTQSDKNTQNTGSARTGPLVGARVAFLVANEGIEQIELTEPWQADDYDAVVLPGGVADPDQLRMDRSAVEFVRGFVDAGKPIAAICHGPWTLVEAGVVRDRTLTSWPSLQTDLRNAGATWTDAEVQVCRSAPSTFVTSRKPDDLEAFCAAMVDAFATRRAGV